MALIRSLAAPPIKEALIDFVIRSRPLSEEELRELAQSVRPDDSWTIGDIARIQATIDVTSEDAFKGSKSFEGIRVKSQDKRVVVAFRPDRVTVSHIDSYNRWEDLQDLALESLRVFVATCGDAQVVRVATRFINFLNLGGSLDAILATPPRSPIDGGAVVDFDDHKITNLPSGIIVHSRQATVIATEDQEEKPAKKIVIDIDAFCECGMSPDDEGLVAILSQLREVKNRVFFGAVTEAALEEYQ